MLASTWYDAVEKGRKELAFQWEGNWRIGEKGEEKREEREREKGKGVDDKGERRERKKKGIAAIVVWSHRYPGTARSPRSAVSPYRSFQSSPSLLRFFFLLSASLSPIRRVAFLPFSLLSSTRAPFLSVLCRCRVARKAAYG